MPWLALLPRPEVAQSVQVLPLIVLSIELRQKPRAPLPSAPAQTFSRAIFNKKALKSCDISFR